MHTHLLKAALAAVVVLLPARAEAQASVPAERTRVETAKTVVGMLLSHREELSLTGGQVDSLTALARRIREDRGRLQIVGLGRVPGKSVPRFSRVYPIQRDARELALRLLSPDQRVQADAVLHGTSMKTAAR